MKDAIYHGNALGPMLFLIYIYTLLFIIANNETIQITPNAQNIRTVTLKAFRLLEALNQNTQITLKI